MPNTKNQKGACSELLVQAFLLKNGYNCFVPCTHNGNRDLLLEIDNHYYGVQIKGCLASYAENGRTHKRYKFNFMKNRRRHYPIESCPIFALVCLNTNTIYFVKNTGQKQLSIRCDKYGAELERASFEALIGDIS